VFSSLTLISIFDAVDTSTFNYNYVDEVCRNKEPFIRVYTATMYTRA